MIQLFKLALRNVLRNRRRSIITLIAVTIGIFSYIFMDGMVDAIQNQSIMMLKQIETAHIKVYAKNYWDHRFKEPLDYLVQDYRSIDEKISEMPDVMGVAERIHFPTRIYDGRNEMVCTGIAIEVGDGDQKVFNLEDSIVKGEYLQRGENAMIGLDLAELFELEIGSWLTLEFRDKNGIYDAAQVVITGIFNTGHPDIDSSVVYLPLDFMQDRLDMEDSVTELAIRLNSEKKLKRFNKELDEMLAKEFNGKETLDTLTWEEQAEDFLAYMKTDAVGNYVIVYILLIIIIVGIMNTMLMAVYERVREIGALRALGMQKKTIRRLFITEGALIGAFGSLIGIALGLIVMIIFSTNGINIGEMYSGQDVGYLVKDYIYGNLRLMPFVEAFILGVVVAIIASYLPARGAAKMKPADALRKY
jgi:ABC-type lipoprotein release transport system permease subunit